MAAIFYLLPLAGLFLENQYEAMSNAARFFAVIGFFAVVAAWQGHYWAGYHCRLRKNGPV
jgi:positive regulator of sigma E activity